MLGMQQNESAVLQAFDLGWLHCRLILNVRMFHEASRGKSRRIRSHNYRVEKYLSEQSQKVYLDEMSLTIRSRLFSKLCVSASSRVPKNDMTIMTPQI